MCIPDGSTEWTVPVDTTFRDWIVGGEPRPPAESDLAYHLTTLFPPVRARGHLELRMIDTQRTDGDWTAALALVTALIDDPAAADRSRAALEPVTEPAWTTVAARAGLADPTVAKAALGCFEAALAAPIGIELREELGRFVRRYVERGRCPADDTLHELTTASARPPEEAA
jgi:glutamate--cysteine ligase